MNFFDNLINDILALFGVQRNNQFIQNQPAPSNKSIGQILGGAFNPGIMPPVFDNQELGHQVANSASASILTDANTVIGIAKSAAGAAAAVTGIAGAISAATGTGAAAATAVSGGAAVAATTAAESAAAVGATGTTVTATGATAAAGGAGLSVAAVAVPLATVAILGVVFTGIGSNEDSERWRSQYQAQYAFSGVDVPIKNPYTGDIEHFGNYKGTPPQPYPDIPSTTSPVPNNMGSTGSKLNVGKVR